MIIAARLLYAQRWKDMAIPIAEELLVKMTESAEMTKWTCWIREKAVSMFTDDWETVCKL